MKNILILFCFIFTNSKAQKILLTDSTQEAISKKVSVDYLLGIPNMYDVIDSFPNKIFAITDCHYTATLKGSITQRGTFEDYMGIHGMKYPFKIFNPKPGMIIQIDRIHVIKKPGASGDIAPVPALEFIVTE
ncbi:hypothetical protein BH11BAC1_BH11BAC1_11990 [soil metagenome]